MKAIIDETDQKIENVKNAIKWNSRTINSNQRKKSKAQELQLKACKKEKNESPW